MAESTQDRWGFHIPDKIDVHVHVHNDSPQGNSEVLRLLRQILAQGESLMSAADDLKALGARIDAATNNIAADITAIKAKIGTGMTDAEVAEVKAGLDASAARLEALDAENPEGQA